jgi:phage FluMu protein Com
MTGDAVFCKGCNVILSNISKVERKGDALEWKCEFCKTVNENIHAGMLRVVQFFAFSNDFIL